MNPTHDTDFLARQLALLGRSPEAPPPVHNKAALTPEAAVDLDDARRAVAAGDFLTARVAAERAAGRAPASPDAQALLGALCLENGDPAAAAQHAAEAARLAPHWAEAARLCGEASYASGDLRAAVEHFRRALAHRPEWPLVKVRLGESMVKGGDLADGFELMRDRFAARGTVAPTPEWDGHGPLWDKTVLILPEREIGDLVQFVRYADLLKRKGARVFVLCPEDLIPLMRTVRGVEDAYALHLTPPKADYVIPLFGLPRLLGTTLGSVPAEVPYAAAEDVFADAWTRHFAALAPAATLRVGVIWADPGEPAAAPVRSLPLVDLSPVWDLPGAAFFALQQGPPHGELALSGAPLIDVSADLNSATAIVAAVSALDLLISIDTPALHVAGALGKPAWALLAAACDWRWMARGETTPWYPSVRCFRQDAPGEWEPIGRRVAAALRDAMTPKPPATRRVVIDSFDVP